MNNGSDGAMFADVQIKCAVEEGMKNIMLAIFGENLRCEVKYDLSQITVDGLGMAHATATAVDLSGDTLVIKADVPIAWPDEDVCIYRIADTVFTVEANDWAKSFKFEVCCENNPYNGAKVIVRQVCHDQPERWLIAESMEDEVFYRGQFENLPFRWAKEVVAEKWAHLSHVALDTERAMMVLFVSRRAPGPSPSEV